MGQISNRETIELIKKSKGVLSATKLYEGQPTLLCEASLCGKVSLFPNSGGIAEFLPKDYEFTFDQFNYKDLIDKLNLLNNEILRKNNSKKAKEFIIFKLDENNIIQQFNQVINEVNELDSELESELESEISCNNSIYFSDNISCIWDFNWVNSRK